MLRLGASWSYTWSACVFFNVFFGWYDDIWWCTLGFNKTEVKVSGHVLSDQTNSSGGVLVLDAWIRIYEASISMKWSLMHGHFPNNNLWNMFWIDQHGLMKGCSGEQSSRTSGWWRQGSGACAQDRWRHGHWGAACEAMAPYIPYIPWVYYTGPWADNSWIDH